MPISHKKEFIFVHIPKTAGGNVEMALDLRVNNELYGYEDENGKHYSVADGLKMIQSGKLETNLCLQHLTADEIRGRYPIDVWNSYFKFSFVKTFCIINCPFN